MNNKTFFVRLFRPFGRVGGHPFLFHLHAQSGREALAWVERVFEGIDVQTTLRRWENPSNVVRVGNTDPVSVIDCDLMQHSKMVAGRRVRLEAQPGQFRASAQQIEQELHRVFLHLMDEHAACVKTFEHFSAQYAASGRQSDFARAQANQQHAQRALVWMNNVWREYYAMLMARSMEIPARQQAA